MATREESARKLFDISTRTHFAESILKNPSELVSRPLEEARERYIEQSEAEWTSFREAMNSYTAERVELLAERFASYEATFNPHIVGKDAPLRELTGQLIDCCGMDIWPGPAAVVDFGVDTDCHLGALQFAIRDELTTPQELDAAMGHGEWLTALARRGGENPYRNVTFRTAWDEIRKVEAAILQFADRPTRPSITPEDPPRVTQKSKPLTM